jgi:hypothetical protein
LSTSSSRTSRVIRLWKGTDSKTPTATPRINSRHLHSGPDFDHRYPSVLIESGRRPGTGSDSYLQNHPDDSHLHPVQAGLVPTESFQGRLNYSCRSLGPASSRPTPWLPRLGLRRWRCPAGSRSSDARTWRRIADSLSNVSKAR